LAGSEPRDARDDADLARCRFAKTGDDDIGERCGAHPQAVALDRLDEAVLPFDAGAQARIRAIAARGRALGRSPRSFALIGDSITASPKYLRPFTRGARHQLDEDVAERLRIDDATVVAFYQAHDSAPSLDAFAAPRVARVGAPSRWALEHDGARIAALVDALSPSVAIVMFGSNDAAVRFIAYDELVESYRARMQRIVDLLVERGVVPVLNTVPRHMHDPSRPSCDASAGDLSNWRLAVQTSALSAAVAELACREHLPLIDLRHALDATPNSGIGPDGVHPTAHRSGAGLLTAEGLRCGYNVRNYVTLRMLAQVVALL
jgi:hypothetical protein